VVDGDGRPLERLMRITRLGEGVDRTGRLAEAAVQRTIDALAEFRAVMDARGVSRVRATATSAVRDAANAGEFNRKVTGVLGVVPEVLAGEEEGRLAYLGATAGLDPSQGPYLVIDVGGGSTELVAGAGPAVRVASLEIGCVRATERFFDHDPPLAVELAAVRDYVRGLVQGAVQAQPDLGAAARLIGLAGTVAALTRLELGLVEYDRDRIHHAPLARASIERLIDELGAVPLKRRVAWPGLEPERADVIIGGAAVLAEAMATLGFEVLTASESDLLDGVAAEMLTG
jgi:exopolyphosphatase/guanosine-5'-triphosphate,3'-diphosphate pyrophosphatase